MLNHDHTSLSIQLGDFEDLLKLPIPSLQAVHDFYIGFKASFDEAQPFYFNLEQNSLDQYDYLTETKKIFDYLAQPSLSGELLNVKKIVIEIDFFIISSLRIEDYDRLKPVFASCILFLNSIPYAENIEICSIDITGLEVEDHFDELKQFFSRLKSLNKFQFYAHYLGNTTAKILSNMLATQACLQVVDLHFNSGSLNLNILPFIEKIISNSNLVLFRCHAYDAVEIEVQEAEEFCPKLAFLIKNHPNLQEWHTSLNLESTPASELVFNALIQSPMIDALEWNLGRNDIVKNNSDLEKITRRVEIVKSNPKLLFCSLPVFKNSIANFKKDKKMIDNLNCSGRSMPCLDHASAFLNFSTTYLKKSQNELNSFIRTNRLNFLYRYSGLTGALLEHFLSKIKNLNISVFPKKAVNKINDYLTTQEVLLFSEFDKDLRDYKLLLMDNPNFEEQVEYLKLVLKNCDQDYQNDSKIFKGL